MSKAGRKTRRFRSVGPVDSEPGWKLFKDFYLVRWGFYQEEKNNGLRIV